MKRSLIACFALIFLIAISWIFYQTVYAASTTVTVNRTGDESDRAPGDGVCDISVNPGHQCTLRAAMEELNALGAEPTPHEIEFDLSGTGPFTFLPSTELPSIDVPMIINGTTQPLAHCADLNSIANLLIIIDGSNIPGFRDGLSINPNGSGSTIRGLVIGNFTDGIEINTQSNNNQIICNFIGVNVDGNTEFGNSTGISIWGSQNLIGGEDAIQRRNIISGNSEGILFRSSAHNNTVLNNYIGPAADGLSEIDSNVGIRISMDSSGNIIGGENIFSRNVISGNDAHGISIFGVKNQILGNYIGVASDSETPLPNHTGVRLWISAESNIIGGVESGEANIIAHNLNAGISTSAGDNSKPDPEFPIKNEFRGNQIFGNGGLGIDLAGDQVTANDLDDLDSGANGLQNFPVLTKVPNSFMVDVTLNSLPDIGYAIDFYRNDTCDSSDHGQGQIYLGTKFEQIDSSGSVNFKFLADDAEAGDFITATATDHLGNTSEFSACVQIDGTPPDTPTPTHTATPPPAETGTATPTLAASYTPTSSPTATATRAGEMTPTPTMTKTAVPDPNLNNDYFNYLPVIIHD